MADGGGMSWVKFRDANTNLNSEETANLWTPSNMDGSGWAVATGGAKTQGGALDKSTSNGLSGLTIALGVVGVFAVVMFMRRGRR